MGASITINSKALAGMSIGVVAVVGIVVALAVANAGIFPTPDPVKIKELLHQYTNEERARLGIAALTYNPTLETVAQSHSDEMARYEYFSHINRDGKSHNQRFSDASISCIGSENLAAPTNAKSNEEIANAAMQAWMNSEQGHRENLLNSKWKSEGFGVAFNTAGDTAYIVQNFCN